MAVKGRSPYATYDVHSFDTPNPRFEAIYARLRGIRQIEVFAKKFQKTGVFGT